MKATRISQGGQVQVPAEIRKRWGTRNVIIQDGGAYIRISPVPDDPIGAVMGSFAGPGPTVNEMMRQPARKRLRPRSASSAATGDKP